MYSGYSGIAHAVIQTLCNIKSYWRFYNKVQISILPPEWIWWLSRVDVSKIRGYFSGLLEKWTTKVYSFDGIESRIHGRIQYACVHAMVLSMSCNFIFQYRLYSTWSSNVNSYVRNKWVSVWLCDPVNSYSSVLIMKKENFDFPFTSQIRIWAHKIWIDVFDGWHQNHISFTLVSKVIESIKQVSPHFGLLNVDETD